MIQCKIFDSLEDFFIWHGSLIDPEVGTINRSLVYSTANMVAGGNKTIGYSPPIPHPSQNFTLDEWGVLSSITPRLVQAMEDAGITTNHTKIMCQIDAKCPENMVPDSLVNLATVQVQGWSRDLVEEGVVQHSDLGTNTGT